MLLPIRSFIFGIAVLFALSACGGGGGGGGGGDDDDSADADDSSTPASFIETDFDIAKVEAAPSAETLTIGVRMADARGDTVDIPFSATSDSICASLTSGINDITIVATSAVECSEEITIVAGNLTKTIVLNVYDPDSMDIGRGLLIKYVNEFESLGTFANSYGVRYWKPVLSKPESTQADLDYNEEYEGYRSLGTMARGSIAGADWNEDLTVTNSIPMIVVKDTNPSEDLLRDPDSYEKIWGLAYSCGLFGVSCATDVFSVWIPVCPAGYGAMGSVAAGTGWVPSPSGGVSVTQVQPPTDSATCIKNEFLIKAEFDFGTKIYDDGGSGNPRDLSLFNGGIANSAFSPEAIPQSQSDKLPLWPGTVNACRTDGVPCTDLFYSYNLLAIPTTVIERKDQTMTTNPQLSGFFDYVSPGPFFVSEIRVPFTLVAKEDPNCGDTVDICPGAKNGVPFNVTSSPFHYLGRQESWQALLFRDNRGGAQTTANTTFSQTNAQLEQESFERETSTTIEYGAGVNYKGFGASYDVTLNETFTFATASSTLFSSEETIGLELIIPADSAASLLTKANIFYSRNETDERDGAIAGGNTARASSSTSFRTLVFPSNN